MTNTRKNIAVEVAASEEADDNKNLKYHYNMAKSNEQLEDILDDLSVIKNNNVAQNKDLVISKICWRGWQRKMRSHQ